MLETIRLGDLTAVAAHPDAPAVPPPRPPILFVHGYMVGAWYFEPYQRFFAERGWPSWAINLRGRAAERWAGALGRVTIADYTADALRAARALAERAGVERPVVIGHSMGGLVAQKVAEAGMAEAAVLLCSAPPRGVRSLSPRLLAAQLRHLWPTLRRRAITAGRDEFGYFSLNRMPAEEHDAYYARAVPDSSTAGRELLFNSVAVDERRVRCPVLVVAATEDRFFKPQVERRLAAKYGAEFLEFSGHAHLLLCEPGWEGPAARIERWLADAVARPEAGRGTTTATASPPSLPAQSA